MSTSHLYRHTNTMLTSWTVPPIPLPFTCLVLLLTASYVFSIVKWRARTRGHPLPPGPRRYPIIGSYRFNKGRDIWQVNQDLYDTYGKYSIHVHNLFPSHLWPRALGDIIYTPMFGRSIVVLGSSRAILDLLEKRSAATTDRPASPVGKLYVPPLHLGPQ